ncbi:LysM peptidoglycan-binding domain-containing protein [Mariprofundus erugo]|uniref:LysM peptidoglycan-binding domain-containing protein n=1 Tax=Mariprofundus erugo TaxID=2528639 RepID=UPI0010FDFDC6|nr:LysM peptidoglycan-binding domain-containing protein [Mariprofundus erugo]TLS77286.1 LysM peptidoglycan-binding domain-containing protein [Mariprofundus erugo]
MRFRCLSLLLGFVVLLSLAPVVVVQAATPDAVVAARNDLPQPYIVKKGDTLWDIANYFFRDPHQWLKIWEKNLYITNPDLIYPGNKIWFNPQARTAGGLTTVRPTPQVIIKPVERLEKPVDSTMAVTILERQDFILPGEEQGMGHILASPDERLNYGVHDRVYLKLDQPVKAGTMLDVFRTTDRVRDPANGQSLGLLVQHMGRVEVQSEENGVYRAVVVRAFEEISHGDRLKLAHTVDAQLHLISPESTLSGRVVYVRNGGHEAAQNQVIGITLGEESGVKAGMQLQIRRAGRIMIDRTSGQPVELPSEKIGDILVLLPQAHASIALITASTAPINVGDTVFGEPSR